MSPNSTDHILTGTFVNPGPLGGPLSIISSMAAYLVIYHDESDLPRYTKPVCAVTLVLSIAGLFATSSRAGILAFSISMIIMLLTDKHITGRLKTLSTSKLSITTSGILILLIISGSLLYLSKKDSADGRILIWKVSSGMIRDNVVLGKGIGAFASFSYPLSLLQFNILLVLFISVAGTDRYICVKQDGKALEMADIVISFTPKVVSATTDKMKREAQAFIKNNESFPLSNGILFEESYY